MALGVGFVSTIVNGATSLSSSLLGFGASIYATNKMQAPPADINSYNIVLPESQSQSVITPGIIILVFVLLFVLLISAFVVYKIA